jgi:hypothetical protein
LALKGLAHLDGSLASLGLLATDEHAIRRCKILDSSSLCMAQQVKSDSDEWFELTSLGDTLEIKYHEQR